MPLGSTSLLQPAAMANLLGDVWTSGQPRFDLAWEQTQCYVHLYGKELPRPGRKMGHLTCLSESSQAAADQARRLRDAIAHRGPKLFE
jgi:5-(carboxyamino)imidazole ribonucleotide synthase